MRPIKQRPSPFRISPEEQAKLDKALSGAQERQAKEDEQEFLKAKEALGKKFGKEQGRSRGQATPTAEAVREDVKLSEPGLDGKFTEKEKEWVNELRLRIKEQKTVIEEDRAILKKAQEEYKALENESQPWYSIFTDPIGTYHADKLKDEREEVGKKRVNLEQLRIYLEELEGDLQKAIQGR